MGRSTIKRREILENAIKITAGARNVAYGEPEDNFQNIANLWNGYEACIKGRDKTKEDVALMMILMKVARLTHNPTHEDSWQDIAGYAACGGGAACAKPSAVTYLTPTGNEVCLGPIYDDE